MHMAADVVLKTRSAADAAGKRRKRQELLPHRRHRHPPPTSPSTPPASPDGTCRLTGRHLLQLMFLLEGTCCIRRSFPDDTYSICHRYRKEFVASNGTQDASTG